MLVRLVLNVLHLEKQNFFFLLHSFSLTICISFIYFIIILISFSPWGLILFRFVLLYSSFSPVYYAYNNIFRILLAGNIFSVEYPILIQITIHTKILWIISHFCELFHISLQKNRGFSTIEIYWNKSPMKLLHHNLSFRNPKV